MDFSISPEQHELTALTSSILSATLDSSHREALDAGGGDFDAESWKLLGKAGLLSITLPESVGGAGLGLVDACHVLVEVGRHAAPVPVGPHVAAVTTLSRHASGSVLDKWGAALAAGDMIVTPALGEANGTIPEAPAAVAIPDADGYRIDGDKMLVTAGTTAQLFLVPARLAGVTEVFLVRADDEGTTVLPQHLSGGYRPANVELAGVRVSADRLIGRVGDGSAARDLTNIALVADCAQQLGVTRRLIEMTSEYASQREQFGRPIGTFQAVGHRLADGFIDTLGQELTLWKAACALDGGTPADAAVAAAKFWAAEAGHRVSHSAVHIHGGVGVDLAGQVHRYFSMAKHLEFRHGGAHHHSTRLGVMMADPERLAAEKI